ncbi:MAG: hypothetical protein H6Q76_1431 [Firmicutes bacterium]|nr:hypothetical protein [Bacillota bacterium]
MKLTVFYDGQFWVGVFEEIIGEKLKAVRYVFGSEPYDYNVMNFVNQRMLSYISRAGNSIDAKIPVRPSNPKRLARETAKEVKRVGVSTFAQEAIKKDREALIIEHKVLSKQLRQDWEKSKRDKKVQKNKEKKRGH